MPYSDRESDGHGSGSWASLSTTVLVARAQDGDRRAIASIYSRHCHAVRLVATKLMGSEGRNDADVEDVVADSFLEAMQDLGAGRFRPDRGSLIRWLTTIVANNVRDRARRQKRAVALVPDSQLAQLAPCPSLPGPTTRLIIEETKLGLVAEVERMAATLNQRYFSVLLLRDVCRQSTDETARDLSLTRQQVVYALYQARRRVGRLLPHGLPMWDAYAELAQSGSVELPRGAT